MGDSWIVDNLNAALNTWNGKLAEIWQLLTESPQTFRGGQVWSVMVGIHGALQAIGYGLLVLFFAIGVVMILSILVDTFSSRILNPMLLPSGKRNIVVF